MQIKAIFNTITTLTKKINEEAVELHYNAKNLNIKATKTHLEALLLKAKKLENELNFYTILFRLKKLNDILDELQSNGFITKKLVKAIKTQINDKDQIQKLKSINIANAPSAGKKTKEEFQKLLTLLSLNK